MYWDGSPSTWSSGSKSSMVFVNSNVQSTELAIGISPSTRDALTLRISHLRANELASPLQFGQATRVVMVSSSANLVSGVTNAHLSDDIFLEYSRVLSPVMFLTAGVSAAVPGKGIKDVTGGDAPNWVGGFVNVVVNY